MGINVDDLDRITWFRDLVQHEVDCYRKSDPNGVDDTKVVLSELDQSKKYVQLRDELGVLTGAHEDHLNRTIGKYVASVLEAKFPHRTVERGRASKPTGLSWVKTYTPLQLK